MDDLVDRFARAERQGLIELVRGRASMPLDALLALIDEGRTGRLLGTLTVAECQAGRADEDAVEQHDKVKLRADYEGRVLAILRETDQPLSPAQVCARLGGTAEQTHVALRRLVAARKIARVGVSGGQIYKAL